MQRDEARAGPRRLRLTLPPDVDAPAAARRALRSLPLGAHADDVLIVASELVTNAVLHAEPAARDAAIELSAACERGRTRVEVREQGDGFADELAGGYGLRVLAAAGDRWGIEHDQATRVWFEIDQ